MAQRH